jgi:hypothetical protein
VSLSSFTCFVIIGTFPHNQAIASGRYRKFRTSLASASFAKDVKGAKLTKLSCLSRKAAGVSASRVCRTPTVSIASDLISGSGVEQGIVMNERTLKACPRSIMSLE